MSTQTPDPADPPVVPVLEQLAQETGGTIDEVGRLPDGSGFAVMSLPLPADHWLTRDPEGFNVPPMPLRCGTEHPHHEAMAAAVTAAARYAVRCATMNGKHDDFDPDALVSNMVTGLLGYHTPDGLSSDEWANPLARHLSPPFTRFPLHMARRDVYGEHEPMLRWFRYEHLPPALQERSRPFGELAQHIVDTLPRNPERTVALRKLLEAKDAAVRAALPE